MWLVRFISLSFWNQTNVTTTLLRSRQQVSKRSFKIPFLRYDVIETGTRIPGNAQCIIMTPYCARWCLKSRASRLSTQPFVQAPIIENIKAPLYCPLRGKLTGDRWIPIPKEQLHGIYFHVMTSSWYIQPSWAYKTLFALQFSQAFASCIACHFARIFTGICISMHAIFSWWTEWLYHDIIITSI